MKARVDRRVECRLPSSHWSGLAAGSRLWGKLFSGNCWRPVHQRCSQPPKRGLPCGPRSVGCLLEARQVRRVIVTSQPVVVLHASTPTELAGCTHEGAVAVYRPGTPGLRGSTVVWYDLQSGIDRGVLLGTGTWVA